MKTIEVNFDGIVGPTHHYAGQAHGNMASGNHRGQTSNPRAAALQGLQKMRLLMDLGCTQAVLPPHERPYMPALRAAGYSGSAASILAKLAKADPALLQACSSASSMWTANAASISPSVDTSDGLVHLTPANLAANHHRSIELAQTQLTLGRIFDGDEFRHHLPVDAKVGHSDEGAANGMRLAPNHGSPGIEVFVYGSDPAETASVKQRFMGRQTRSACTSIIASHNLPADQAVILQQSPKAIDAGVFHNDVIATANENLLLVHDGAFVDQIASVKRLCDAFQHRYDDALHVVSVSSTRVPLKAAVGSYLFNSQIVTRPDGGMTMIAPAACQEYPAVKAIVQEMIQGNSPLTQVMYVDLQQSMRNGGGPACLRLRAVLTESELAAVQPRVILSETRLQQLEKWVNDHYRESLGLADLADPKLLEESNRALDELTQLLGLGSIYPFQR